MDILEVVVPAVLGAAGGAAVVLGGLSSFLGRIWADRIVEAQRAKFTKDLEQLRSQLETDVRRMQGEDR